MKNVNSEERIYKTKNYKMFSKMRGNRKIDNTNLRRIQASVKEINLLSKQPILVNDKYQIIDGQHRLKIAEKLKIHVYYIIGKKLQLEEVQKLNNVSKKWELADYMESHAKLGKEEYIYMKQFYETYKLPISTCVLLLSGNRNDYGESFKNGKFKIKSKENAVQTATFINTLKKENPHYCLKGFILALKEVRRKNPNEKRLVEILTAGVKQQINTKEYIQEIQNKYNHGLLVKNKLLFVKL